MTTTALFESLNHAGEEAAGVLGVPAAAPTVEQAAADLVRAHGLAEARRVADRRAAAVGRAPWHFDTRVARLLGEITE